MKYTNRKCLAILSWVTASCCLTACGSDSSDSSNSAAAPALTTGVAEDKQLADLSDGELEKLNKAVSEYSAKAGAASLSTDTLCQYTGAVLALAASGESSPTDKDLQSTCSAFAKTCMDSVDSAAQNPASTSGESHNMERAELANCRATVAEFEACMEDQTKAALKLVTSLPKCSELTTASMSAAGASDPEEATPASCKIFVDKCPEALPDDASSGEDIEDDSSYYFEDESSDE